MISQLIDELYWKELESHLLTDHGLFILNREDYEDWDSAPDEFRYAYLFLMEFIDTMPSIEPKELVYPVKEEDRRIIKEITARLNEELSEVRSLLLQRLGWSQFLFEKYGSRDKMMKILSQESNLEVIFQQLDFKEVKVSK